jgi:rhamnose utilization protein RhaD (predicted bifunctional aldolase and dehydrogenase)
MQGNIVFVIALNNTNVQKTNTNQLGKELYFMQVINSGGDIKTRKIMGVVSINAVILFNQKVSYQAIF